MEEKINKKLEESVAFVKSRITESYETAIVLGSGLGPLAEVIEDPVVIPYDKIPHFAKPTVAGHAGELICGSLKGENVIGVNGRFHFYEGFSMERVTYPFKLLKMLGVKTLILTNAAGGINREFKTGELMIIRDHLNLMGTSPLIGANNDALGVRFPDMSSAYSKRLASIAIKAGKTVGIHLREGVYAALTGPNYETPAEIRMLGKMGADAVGMSTVPEVIVGNHMAMEILAISCITNAAAGIGEQKLSHDDVTGTAAKVKNDFAELMETIIGNINNKIEEDGMNDQLEDQTKTDTGDIANSIDHTILKPEATGEEIEKICQEAIEYSFKAVCVNSANVALVSGILKNEKPVPIAVVGFPLGAAVSSSKAFEAKEAVKAGAKEIDMVINLGALKAKDYHRVLTDIQAVVDASRPNPVKVIVETGSLNEDEKIVACALSKAGGAAFVKTSTGFTESGATVEDVKLMRRVVGEDMGVKASGGIKTAADARRMISAGADRIGTSASVDIVSGK